MSSKLISMTNKSSRADFEEICTVLEEELGAEELYKIVKNFDDSTVTMATFEKFYFRTSSYANLTILFTERKDIQEVDIIGSAGGEGVFNISWGANSNFALKSANIFARYGFNFVEEN
ncbi:DUF6054 family protein [Peptoniphilus asaccharolyticus]